MSTFDDDKPNAPREFKFCEIHSIPRSTNANGDPVFSGWLVKQMDIASGHNGGQGYPKAEGAHWFAMDRDGVFVRRYGWARRLAGYCELIEIGRSS